MGPTARQIAEQGTSTWTGALLALGSSAAVGSAIAATTSLTKFPILTGQAARYGLAAALLAIFCRQLPRLNWTQLTRVVVLGATGLAGFNVCLVLALQRVDAGVVGAIVGAVPVVLAILGPLMVRRRPALRVLAAACIVTAGAAILQWSGAAQDPIGLLLAAGALAGECAFSLVAIKLLREIGPTATATYAAAAGAVLCGVIALATEWQSVRLPEAAELTALLYLAVVASAGAFTMWYSALDRLPVEAAGIFAGVVPVCALLTAVVLGESTGSPLRFLGAAIVGLGVVLAIRPPTHSGHSMARHRVTAA